ncbi:hypothetical protein [Mycobacterium sp. shizuoka-1]|uniref:hypothetical protein n=1 Tax=Mycobacterium sp. shizuoka-1 TaxID=2039281 RepID=UPI000C065B1A|nr:hypothetical protein [Mycobacterium sp. shizuoka-1]GAY16528.1 hypothetical protein MSZK_32540 [Mycobacterium sp. shizuoka-1]
MPARNTDLRSALRRAAAAMTADGPDFSLAGSEVEAAAKSLADAGFTVERPPEDWLVKACVGDDFVIDVLHRLNGVPVDAATLENAVRREVLAVSMRALPPTYVLIEKLCSLGEHHCDFAALLPPVRAVREQVDWDSVRTGTAHNDFAVAFLTLTDRLGITA